MPMKPSWSTRSAVTIVNPGRSKDGAYDGPDNITVSRTAG